MSLRPPPHNRRERPPSPGAIGRALGLVASVACVAGCEPLIREVPVRLEIPEESAALEAADNFSLYLEPDGTVAQYDVDGLDFVVSLEIEEADVIRTLSAYLALGDTLLAWGRTDPFFGASIGDPVALFLGLPGRLATLQGTIAAPDPDLQAAAAIGRGVLIVGGSGDTALFQSYPWTFAQGATLDDPPAPGTGGLFAVVDGAVMRLAWETTWFSARYEPASDIWLPLTLDPTPVARPGAIVLESPAADRVYLLGGDGMLDGLAVGMLPDAQGRLATATLEGFTMDRPRDGGTAIWATPADSTSDRLMIFGGDSPGPLVWVWPEAVSAGTPLTWTGARCARVESAAIWCAGGTREGVLTRSLVRIDLADPSVPVVTEFPDVFPVDVPDPRLWAETGAVYAQAEGHLWRLEPATSPEAPPTAVQVMDDALRATGGYFIRLDSGATFLAGGVTLDGTPVDRWQVFTPDPTLDPSAP